MSMSRKIAISRGWQLKDGMLVPCYKYLPVNLRLQQRASKRVRAGKGGKSVLARRRRLRGNNKKYMHETMLALQR
jgi:hypothetical protein